MNRKRHNKFIPVIALLALVVVFFLATYGFNQATEDIPEKRSEIISAYIFAIFISVMIFSIVVYSYLKWRIYDLVVPNRTVSIDDQTSKLAGFIALICLAGVIGMVSLLVVDAVGHLSAFPLDGSTAVPEQEEPAQLPIGPFGVIGKFMGTFGDFFGGVLNPFLTFCTIIALAIATLMQRIQLRDAKIAAIRAQKQIRRQAFEATFFNLLNLHVSIVESLRFDPSIFRPSPGSSGVISIVANYFRPAAPVRGREVFPKFLRSTLQAASITKSQINIYREVQKTHNDIVGHYFRNLFQILNLIENFSREEYPDVTVTGGNSSGSVDTNQLKRHKLLKYYSNILRAQLSSHELAVLFLNCTDGTVDQGAFKKLLIKTSFLEHLPVLFDGCGKMTVPDVDTADVALFEEYFERSSGAGNEQTSGAFGANEGILKYLAFKKEIENA